MFSEEDDLDDRIKVYLALIRNNIHRTADEYFTPELLRELHVGASELAFVIDGPDFDHELFGHTEKPSQCTDFVFFYM